MTDTPGPLDQPDQSYYWTDEWQTDEQEAVAELERGEGRRFADPADAVAWLTEGERP
jgi:hypothetical protein